MRFAKIVFLAAGIYGLLVLMPLYFMESRIGQQAPPAITHPEFFYGFIGIGVAWQVLFLFLSTDPARYRPMIVPSIIEKISYAVAVIVLYTRHRVSLGVLAIGSVDWIFFVLFIAAYMTTSAEG